MTFISITILKSLLKSVAFFRVILFPFAFRPNLINLKKIMFGRLFIFVVLFCQQYHFIAILLCVTVFNTRPDWFFTPSSFPCFSVQFYFLQLFQQIKPESNKQNSRHGFWFSCIRTYIYLNSVIELFKPNTAALVLSSCQPNMLLNKNFS